MKESVDCVIFLGYNRFIKMISCNYHQRWHRAGAERQANFLSQAESKLVYEGTKFCVRKGIFSMEDIPVFTERSTLKASFTRFKLISQNSPPICFIRGNNDFNSRRISVMYILFIHTPMTSAKIKHVTMGCVL